MKRVWHKPDNAPGPLKVRRVRTAEREPGSGMMSVGAFKDSVYRVEDTSRAHVARSGSRAKVNGGS